MIIAVSGVTGVGKTTLVNLLARELGADWRPVLEPVEQNPYLPLADLDPSRWSLTLQIQYLIKRYKIHQGVSGQSGHHVFDRTIYEGGGIFMPVRKEMGWITDDELSTYRTLEQILISGLEPPRLLIYLMRSLDQAQEGIARRGRSFEKNMDPAFLSKMERHYDRWFEEYDLGPKMRLDASALDFIERPSDLAAVASRSREAIRG